MLHRAVPARKDELSNALRRCARRFGRARAQLQSVTWIDGLNRPTATPAPRSIPWVARGVVTNRVSSAADGGACPSPRVVMLHEPCACRVGPDTRRRSPLV